MTESSVSSHLIAVNVLAAVTVAVVVLVVVVVDAAAVVVGVVAGAAAPALVSVGWCCVKPIRHKD